MVRLIALPYTNDSCVNVNRNQYELFQLMEHQIKELLIPEQVHGCESLVIGESFLKILWKEDGNFCREWMH